MLISYCGFQNAGLTLQGDINNYWDRATYLLAAADHINAHTKWNNLLPMRRTLFAHVVQQNYDSTVFEVAMPVHDMNGVSYSIGALGEGFGVLHAPVVELTPRTFMVEGGL